MFVRTLWICLLTVTPGACFLAGSHPRVLTPLPAEHSTVMVTKVGSGSTSSIAWPDAQPTPTLDGPIRARIVAIAPIDIDSPFEDRGKHAPWFEVSQVFHDGNACYERT